MSKEAQTTKILAYLEGVKAATAHEICDATQTNHNSRGLVSRLHRLGFLDRSGERNIPPPRYRINEAGRAELAKQRAELEWK